MFKKTLLSLALATSVLSLAACNDTETAADPVEPMPPVEAVEEVNEMPATGVVEEDVVTADPMDMDMNATQSISEMAADNENLTVLTEALKATGLDQTLMDDGPFTVFAPTDEAFNELLTSLGVTKDELFADKEMLTNVLSYHVIPDKAVMADEIPYDGDIATVNGKPFSISNENIITDASGARANIVQTDIMASNGVVHVVDKVLMPK